jgi:hypothetical protein
VSPERDSGDRAPIDVVATDIATTDAVAADEGARDAGIPSTTVDAVAVRDVPIAAIDAVAVRDVPIERPTVATILGNRGRDHEAWKRSRRSAGYAELGISRASS